MDEPDLSDKSWHMDTTTINSLIAYKITTTSTIKTVWIFLRLPLC